MAESYPWEVLRIQIVWQDHHTDKDLLGMEVPKDVNGEPIKRADWHEKIAAPRTEVVLYRETADGAGEVKAVFPTASEVKRVVKALTDGKVTDDAALATASRPLLSDLPLDELFPSLAKYDVERPEVSVLDS